MVLQYNFAAVGCGRLALSGRPKVKEIRRLQADGCDRVITLLGRQGEQAYQIGAAVEVCGMGWDWLKVSKARTFSAAERVQLLNGLERGVAALEARQSLLVHCSAGLHRTGMFAYALLRRLALDHDEAMACIVEMRPETAAALDEQYLSAACSLILG